VEGNPGGPGRPRGSKNSFPRGTKQIMKGLLSGEFRDGDSGETAGLKVAKLIMDGLDGKVYQERIGPDDSITKISVSQAVFASCSSIEWSTRTRSKPRWLRRREPVASVSGSCCLRSQ
jgi:hypothetical protein